MIREKINEALTDMPQNPQILELLEGTRKKHSQPPYYNMHNIPCMIMFIVCQEFPTFVTFKLADINVIHCYTTITSTCT